MAEFYVFYKKGSVPPVEELNRAMSSRGIVFEIQGETPIHERSALKLQVDGADVPVSVSVVDAAAPDWNEMRSQAQELEDGAARLSVLKNCDVRISLTAEGEAGSWARDVARNVSLLACGAFENPSNGKFINFGR
jgi:hypothetical protein